ncbi:MAG: iron(III) transport system permease protein [Verrucomicrobiota bacterium]|jgi:iron(III) transport system permease protein
MPALDNPLNWTLLTNSLIVSALATFLATIAGFGAALALASAHPKWRRCLLVAVVVAVAMPPFLVANSWLDLLGPKGVLRHVLPFNLHSLGATAALLASLTWPLTTLLTIGAWTRLEPQQLESDPLLRGCGLLRWLLWPMARTGVFQAALLTFVLALNNFSVPVIFQVPVFPEELWLAFTTRLNDAGAWAAAIPTILVPLVLVLLLRRSEISWPRIQGSATSAALQRQLGPVLFMATVILTAALLGLSLGVPLVQIAGSRRTWIELPTFLRASPDVVLNSFIFASAAATVCVAAGLALRRLPLGVVSWIPFLIPGVLLGRLAITTLNGTIFYPSSGLIILLFAFRYLAIGWSGASIAFRSMDRNLTDVARLGGARGWALFRHVQWPQVAPFLAAAWYAIYLLCLWDVETLVLIQPAGGETLAVRIFNLLHYGHNAQVNALCVTLLALASMPLLLWRIGQWIARR